MEKNIEVVIGRRFKRWGMCWSREGAQNLLKLRILRYDREDLVSLLAKASMLGGEPLHPLEKDILGVLGLR
jgi:hypothetical protein